MSRLKHSARSALLALALGASAYLAVYWSPTPQATADLPVLAKPTGNAVIGYTLADSAGSTPRESDPSLLAPKRVQHSPVPGGDAFALMSWLPPPKASPPPAPPPPPVVVVPTAPPLPFTFVGLLEKGVGIDQPKAFLARGDTLLVVAAGDTVENNYSVDSITAQQITLTYLPLKTRQTLAVTGATR
jgi:hypothetical protein